MLDFYFNHFIFISTIHLKKENHFIDCHFGWEVNQIMVTHFILDFREDLIIHYFKYPLHHKPTNLAIVTFFVLEVIEKEDLSPKSILMWFQGFNFIHLLDSALHFTSY